MPKKKSKSDIPLFSDFLLEQLLRDPTRPVKDMARALGTYRQKLWRRKKKLEDEKVVWGYTAVVGEERMGHVLYMVLLKMKPMTRELADLIIHRVARGEPSRQRVRLINLLYVNGEYDWVLMFSASDHATARRYYDSLRVAYEEYLLDKPAIIDVNFPLIREGKVNPELVRLREFVPL